MYYNTLCCFPTEKALDRHEFEPYVHFEDYDNPIYIMYISARCVCEQICGMLDAAEESMQLARTAVGKMFHNHANPFVIWTYGFLSLYESGCGEITNARFYVELVRFHVEQEPTDNMSPTNRQQLRLLKKLLGSVELSSLFDKEVLFSLKRWADTLEKLGVNFPKEFQALLHSDVDESNYKSIMRIIDMGVQIARSEVNHATPQEIPLDDVYLTIYFNGLKIAILEKIGKDNDTLEKYALAVTSATEHKLFTFGPSHMVTFVSVAARAHLRIVKSIERGERANPSSCFIDTPSGEQIPILVDYYEVLQKDYRALLLLSTKFKQVEKYQGLLLNEIELAIRSRTLYQLGQLQRYNPIINPSVSTMLSKHPSSYPNHH